MWRIIMKKDDSMVAVLGKIADELSESERNGYFTNHYDRYLATLQALYEVAGEKIGPGLKVLDVGCIPGHLGSALAKMGCEVHGLSCEVEYNRSIFKTPDIEDIRECNIETDSFPYQDSYFDLVLFTETIEHLPFSPLPALREMHRVLKKDGYLLLTTPNDLYIDRRISRIKSSLLFKSSFTDLKGLKARLELPNVYSTHHLKYTIKEINAVLEWTGFQVVKEAFFPRSTGFGRISYIYYPVKLIEMLLARFVPKLRLYLLAVAKRV
jgi:SAM-dependent methyltransferase